MSDLYNTIAEASTGEFRDRGSKFLAYAYPISDEADWLPFMEALKREHLKARHHCYAYRLGLDKNRYRANDDGEPSGTAGRPILGQIDSFGLTNIIVIVVRYFGGTKLGTSGLINAYKTSTQSALENAKIVEKQVSEYYKIRFDYTLMSNVMNAVKALKVDIIEQEFTDTGNLKISIRQSEALSTLKQLRSKVAQIRIEEIDQVKLIPGFELDHLYTL